MILQRIKNISSDIRGILLLSYLINSCSFQSKEEFRFYPGIFKFTIIEFDKEYFFPLYIETPYKIKLTDIFKTEKILKNKINNLNKNLASYEKKMELEDYFLQYMGAINTKGEIIIYVQGMCRVSGDYWRTQMTSVNDGGCCYFQTTINLSTGYCRRLGCNGEA